jgi:hypothetical protein
VTIWGLVAANWTPRTREQGEAVERLGDECGGVLVRSLSDGAAEVLAVQRGVYDRYVVREDGSPVIVESRPRDWRYPLGYVLRGGFLVFAFGIPLLLIAMNYAHVATRDLRGAVALISLGVGMVLFVAVLAVGPWPYRLMHPGDRRSDWDQVRWPED